MPAVTIAGGGYAGVAAARLLMRRTSADWAITLIDRRPAHELLTRLPEVLSARIDPTMARIPYERIVAKSVRVVQADVVRLESDGRRVVTSAGEIQGDWLILALGARPGIWSSLAPDIRLFPLRSVDAALSLREAVIGALAEQTVVRAAIVGGGYTGTEVAGELATWPHGGGRLDVTLIAEEPRLLGQGNERMAEAAARILAGRGVRLLLSRSVRSIEQRRLTLSDGTNLDADLIVWATPAVGAPEARSSEGPQRPDGRVAVDDYLRVPTQERVFAAGDVAASYDYVHGRPLPSSAQLAVQEGELAARNILAESSGALLHPLRPRLIGEALTLGGDTGVAEVLGVVVTGWHARAVKEAALARYLYRLGGARLAGRYAVGIGAG
jgi:NADH dehydrogenase